MERISIHEKLNGISKFYDLSYKLFDITKHYLNKDTLQQYLPQLANPIFKSSPGLLTNKGTILTTYLNVTKSPNLVELLNNEGNRSWC